MATAILDLNIENLPLIVNGLRAYNKALILLRYKSRPIGKILLPVWEGTLFLEDFQSQILDVAGWHLSYEWLYDYLQYNSGIATSKSPTATVAVCTRNRTADLRRCLDALMKLPNDGQEFLVIDNCPSDDSTRKLVETYKRVRYICEMNPGLNIARNRALKESRNEIVAYTDDDASPDAGWLRAITGNFENPLVACVTGLTMPLELETEAQEAFEKYNSFEKGFRRKVHSNQTRNPLSTGEVGAGANMAIRRSITGQIGFFDEALDAGTLTQSGGDHEYFARILLGGFQIVYEPCALSWHRHRRTWKETRKAIEGYGVGVYAFWTRCLLVEREVGILKFPLNWLLYTQIPKLFRSVLRRPSSQPLSLIIAEFRGCVRGPLAYLISSRRLKKRQRSI